jgi:hypothetical protein
VLTEATVLTNSSSEVRTDCGNAVIGNSFGSATLDSVLLTRIEEHSHHRRTHADGR